MKMRDFTVRKASGEIVVGDQNEFEKHSRFATIDAYDMRSSRPTCREMTGAAPRKAV